VLCGTSCHQHGPQVFSLQPSTGQLNDDNQTREELNSGNAGLALVPSFQSNVYAKFLAIWKKSKKLLFKLMSTWEG